MSNVFSRIALVSLVVLFLGAADPRCEWNKTNVVCDVANNSGCPTCKSSVGDGCDVNLVKTYTGDVGIYTVAQTAAGAGAYKPMGNPPVSTKKSCWVESSCLETQSTAFKCFLFCVTSQPDWCRKCKPGPVSEDNGTYTVFPVEVCETE